MATANHINAILWYVKHEPQPVGGNMIFIQITLLKVPLQRSTQAQQRYAHTVCSPSSHISDW